MFRRPLSALRADRNPLVAPTVLARASDGRREPSASLGIGKSSVGEGGGGMAKRGLNMTGSGSLGLVFGGPEGGGGSRGGGSRVKKGMRAGMAKLKKGLRTTSGGTAALRGDGAATVVEVGDVAGPQTVRRVVVTSSSCVGACVLLLWRVVRLKASSELGRSYVHRLVVRTSSQRALGTFESRCPFYFFRGGGGDPRRASLWRKATCIILIDWLIECPDGTLPSFPPRVTLSKVLRVIILEAEGLRNVAVLKKTDSYVSADLVTNSGTVGSRTSVKKVCACRGRTLRKTGDILSPPGGGEGRAAFRRIPCS